MIKWLSFCSGMAYGNTKSCNNCCSVPKRVSPSTSRLRPLCLDVSDGNSWLSLALATGSSRLNLKLNSSAMLFVTPIVQVGRAVGLHTSTRAEEACIRTSLLVASVERRTTQINNARNKRSRLNVGRHRRPRPAVCSVLLPPCWVDCGRPLERSACCRRVRLSHPR